jgi:hypothetical protein
MHSALSDDRMLFLKRDRRSGFPISRLGSENPDPGFQTSNRFSKIAIGVSNPPIGFPEIPIRFSNPRSFFQNRDRVFNSPIGF